MRALRHLTQPSSDSCVATCVAMILGQKEVDKQFHIDHYMNREITISSYLLKHGVRAWRPHYLHDQMPHRLGEGSIYLVQAPSLNFDNALHTIIVDYRTEHPQVLDPNKGRKGMRVYARIGSGHDELRTWTVELVVDPSSMM